MEPAFLKPNAVLLSAGQEKPTTVYGRPPAWDKMGESMRERLIGVLRNWSEMTRSNDMNPWVIYIPDSRRTFHGMLRYSHTNSPQDLWKPGDFASGLGSTCSNLSINFIDTYPELRRQSERGIVPYNLIGDTHLSREGSRIVAGVLVDSLQAAKKE